jgi:OOP family OmpA-OmpF porin
MGRKYIALATAVAIIALLGGVSPSGAQLGKLTKKAKEKIEKKAEEKTDKKMDEAIEKATGEGENQAAPPATGSEAEAEGEEATAAPGAAGGDFALYKKYDFVPGDKVIFFDDLSGEDVGEFPSRWNLERGVFEVAELGPEKWIAGTDDGAIMPKIGVAALPERYTVELEYYDHGGDSRGHWVDIVWIGPEEKELASFHIGEHGNTSLYVNGVNLADKVLVTPTGKGVHTMRVMASKSSIKCFLDNERMANVPKVDGFNPVGFKIRTDLYNEQSDKYPLLIRNFRFAEGGKTLREQLDEAGRIVTHGILFSTGSSEIRPESYKTLADIGTLLAADATLRVSIEGHTDADGADDANLKLSEARAASVRTYLSTNYKVTAERLESRGLGETKPIDTNDSPEGKANNRRVELVKL